MNLTTNFQANVIWLCALNPEFIYTYTTLLTMALLNPVKSKSLKFKLIAMGLSEPCKISIRLMRNGSMGGIAKPECPSGCSCTISVISFGKQTVSPARHLGKSAAVWIKQKQEEKKKLIIKSKEMLKMLISTAWQHELSSVTAIKRVPFLPRPTTLPWIIQRNQLKISHEDVRNWLNQLA